MEQATVKISNDKLDLVKRIKKATGVPIQRFIDEAIELKASKLPKSIRLKIDELKNDSNQ